MGLGLGFARDLGEELVAGERAAALDARVREARATRTQHLVRVRVRVRVRGSVRVRVRVRVRVTVRLALEQEEAHSGTTRCIASGRSVPRGP